MGYCDFVNMFKVAFFHCLKNRQVFIIGVNHPAFVRQGEFGEFSHPIFKGIKKRRKLPVLYITDNFGMKLEIIFAKVFDGGGCV